MASTAGMVATRDYVESYLTEDAPLLDARTRAAELGCGAVSPASGALLRFFAGVIAAKTVVEIGTGAGVSGLWLLRGMRADGVLTSVDTEAEHQRAARQAFADAGIGAHRARLIQGAAAEVLPRLTDGAYDLVFADAAKTEYSDYLTEALRLLRPGGIVVFNRLLAGDRIADSGVRDPETVAVRELGKQIADRDDLLPVLVQAGEGLLAAVYRSAITQ
jgi:predicted O-methyltransferase YrrM